MVLRYGVAAVLLGLLLAVLPASADKNDDEPDTVLVQHILIGYKRSIPGKNLDRSRKEARALAEQLLARAEKGEDFDALVKEYTDDQYPGKMLLINDDAPPVSGGTPRSGVVPRFGDVAFGLEVGEVAMAAHHAALSPYGWHLIKRLE